MRKYILFKRIHAQPEAEVDVKAVFHKQAECRIIIAKRAIQDTGKTVVLAKVTTFFLTAPYRRPFATSAEFFIFID